MFPREVFLSHVSKDRDFAGRLAEELRRHGVPVWYSPTNILGAQQWHDEIGAALKRCDWFLVLLSESAVRSFWVKRELCYALQQRRYLNRITPVLLQPCDFEQLSWTLSASQFIDFSAGFENGCRALLRVWGLGWKPL
ncbi:MAG: toll/interleukin-1 receptor domain-containing protein [Verrucomicrobiota bacterium]|jgi:hypothetical protein